MTEKAYRQKKEENIKVFTLDTETRGFRGEIFRAGLFDGVSYTPSLDFQNLKQILLEASLTHSVHIFIHNLNFEMSKIIQDLSGEIDWLRSIIINSRMAVIKCKDFTFHDSYSLFPKSLEKLCVDFKVKNQKIDLTERLKGTDYYVERNKREITVYDEKNDIKTFIVKEIPEKERCNKDKTLENFFMNVDPLDPLLNEYLEYDCRSLYEIVVTAFKISGLKLKDFLINPTTASLAMTTFRKKFSKQFDLACKSKYEGRDLEVEQQLNAAYYGGRTEVFKNRCFNGFHYDFNSLYPYCMEKYKFPIGDYKKISGLNAKIQFNMFKRSGKGGGVARVKVYCPKDINKQGIPILPHRTEGSKKLLFGVGEFWGSWTLVELQFAESRGYKILEWDYMIYYYEMEDLFSHYVKYFKKLKEDNAKGVPGRNESLYEYAKLLLNALYGKFAMGRERVTFTSMKEIPETIEKLMKNGEYFIPEIKFFMWVQEGGMDYAQEQYLKTMPDDLIYRMPKRFKQSGSNDKLIQYLTYVTSDYIQIQISAYVTSYARIELYKGMENVWKNGGYVYYVDTDSIVSDVEVDQDLIHPSIFGKLDREGIIVEAAYLQPKVYAEVTTENKYVLKFKGLPKGKVKDFNLDDYLYLLKRQELKDQEKVLLIDFTEGYEQLIKPITAIKQNKAFNTMNPIEKSLNIRQAKEKRKMDIKNNTSIPWSFSPGDPDLFPDFDFNTYEFNKATAERAEKKFNRYENFVREKGFVRVPAENSYLYQQYLLIDPKIRRKYFRKKGTSSLLDLAKATEVYFEEDLLLNLQCM
jgi:hypothetical protein